MYKLSYRKRLSKKMSERAKRGWMVRRLRMEAEPREVPFEEMVARHKHDRKGTWYATWNREGLTMELYHSLNRSDQFDVIIKGKKICNLSLPKALKIFAK